MPPRKKAAAPVPAAPAWAAFLRPGEPLPTDEQIAVIEADEPLILVDAVAGSGKTKTVVMRAKRLAMEGKGVLLTAFNKAAAATIEDRVAGFSDRIQVQTIYSAAFAVAAQIGVRVDNSRRLRNMIHEYREDSGVGSKWAGAGEYRASMRTISKALNRVLQGHRYGEETLQDTTRRLIVSETVDGVGDIAKEVLWQACDELLPPILSAKLTDFGSVSTTFYHANAALEQGIVSPAFKNLNEIVVDEAQDLAPENWTFFEMLMAVLGTSLVIIGDIDQCIYEFRGVIPEDFLARAKAYARYPMTLSFRCPRNVIHMAGNTIKNNKLRTNKPVIPARADDGEVICSEFGDPFEEARVAVKRIERLLDKGEKKIAVFTRTNKGRVPVEIELFTRHIPFMVMGKPIWNQIPVKTVIEFFNGVHDNNPGAMREALRELKGVGQKTADAVIAQARRTNIQNALATVSSYGEGEKQLRRAAKTVETILPMVAQGQIPPAIQEVINLFYPAKDNVQSGDESDGGASGNRDDAEAVYTLSLTCSGDWKVCQAFLKQLEAAEKELEDEGLAGYNGVLLATVHKMKGAEFNHVLLFQTGGGIWPHYKAVRKDIENGDQRETESERRLFYVALTRTLQTLWIGFSSTNEREKPEGASPFLEETGVKCGASVIEAALIGDDEWAPAPKTTSTQSPGRAANKRIVQGSTPRKPSNPPRAVHLSPRASWVGIGSMAGCTENLARGNFTPSRCPMTNPRTTRDHAR